MKLKKKKPKSQFPNNIILNDKIKKTINKKEEDWVVGGWIEKQLFN